jgi:hypothetical protein
MGGSFCPRASTGMEVISLVGSGPMARRKPLSTHGECLPCSTSATLLVMSTSVILREQRAARRRGLAPWRSNSMPPCGKPLRALGCSNAGGPSRWGCRRQDSPSLPGVVLEGRRLQSRVSAWRLAADDVAAEEARRSGHRDGHLGRHRSTPTETAKSPIRRWPCPCAALRYGVAMAEKPGGGAARRPRLR